jgi:hypothetical protein
LNRFVLNVMQPYQCATAQGDPFTEFISTRDGSLELHTTRGSPTCGRRCEKKTFSDFGTKHTSGSIFAASAWSRCGNTVSPFDRMPPLHLRPVLAMTTHRKSTIITFSGEENSPFLSMNADQRELCCPLEDRRALNDGCRL